MLGLAWGWAMGNKHLLPSVALFYAGFLLVLKVPLYYAYRTKDYRSLLNPGKVVLENRREMVQLILGIILFIAGAVSYRWIISHDGYYYVTPNARIHIK